MADGQYFGKIITNPADKDANHVSLAAEATGWFMKIFGATKSKLLDAASNLSDVKDAETARRNLGLGLLGINTTTFTGTNTTNEEIYHSFQIAPNILAAKDLLRVFTRFNSVINSNQKTVRMYINTLNSLSGATLIAAGNSTSASTSVLSRILIFHATTLIKTPLPTDYLISNEYSPFTTSNPSIVVPDITNGIWIIISGQKAVAGDAYSAEFSFIEILRK